MTEPRRSSTVAAERLSGQLLIGFTYLAVGFLIAGVLAMIALGVAPLAGGPQVELADFLGDLAALQPSALMAVGIALVIAAPLARVVVAGIAYATEADWRMVAVSIGILLIITVGVVTALGVMTAVAATV